MKRTRIPVNLIILAQEPQKQAIIGDTKFGSSKPVCEKIRAKSVTSKCKQLK